MPWIEKRRGPHRCPAPEPRLWVETGSVWQCRRCKARWTLTRNRIAADGYTHTWSWSPGPRTTAVNGQ